jgi:hypothetical protein
VWPDGAAAYEQLAAFLTSAWNVIGNGTACGIPLSRLDRQIAAERNLVWLGVPRDRVPGASAVPISWSAEGFAIAGSYVGTGLLQFVFPAGDRLNAVITATPGAERWLRYLMPFSSRSGMPDFAVISTDGGLSYAATGWFTPDWQGIDVRNSSY